LLFHNAGKAVPLPQSDLADILLSWSRLCEFAGIDEQQGDFIQDVLTQMNGHIAETSQDREPWVWIMEIVLSEIAAGKFRHPFEWATSDISRRKKSAY
jgi:hypothetical protein